MTVQLPKPAKSRKVNGKVIPYGYSKLKVAIQGEATTKTDTSTITLDGDNKYQKTISDVSVGLNVATIQILDASNNMLAQRTHGFYMTAGGTPSTGDLPMGVAITATGACDPQNIDIPAGTTLVFENLDTANNRTVSMNSGAVTVGPIDKVTAASGETIPATYNYASHTFSTAGTYTYDDGLGAPGRVLVTSSPTVKSIVDNDGNDYDTKTASSSVTFTITGAGLGTSQAAVNGKVEFKNMDAAGTIEATVSTWNNTTIAGNVDIPQGTYRVAVTSGGTETTDKVLFFKGYDWHFVPECLKGFPSVGQADYTSLVIYDNNGIPVPYVAYEDYENFGKVTVKKFDGTSWETVGTAGFSTGSAYDISLVVYDNNGNPVPYVAYCAGDNSYKATVMKFNGTSWETVGTNGFSTGQAGYTSLAVYDNAGTPVPYVAYRDFNNSSKATVMRFNGTSWETVGIAGFSAGIASYSSLVIHEGIPYVAYRDENYSGKAVVMKFTDSSPTKWEALGTAGFSDGPADWTRLLFIGDDPYVAFKDYSSGIWKATVMKHTGNGTTGWEAVGSKNFSSGSIGTISLSCNGNIPYVAYRDNTQNSKVTTKKFNGTAWETVGASGFSAGQADYTSLAVFNNAGSPILYVAYQDGGNNNKATVMQFDGTSWETVGTAGFSAGAINYTSLVVYDDSGTPVPYVAYQDSGNSSKATVMKFTGSNWETVGTAGFSAGTAYYTSLAVYDDGGTPVPYVAYQDSGNSSKATVMKFTGSNWETVGTAGFSAGTAYYTSLAVYDDGGTPVPYVAYRDVGNSDKATVMKFNGTSWETVGSAGFSDSTANYISFAVYDSEGTAIPYVGYRDGNNARATVKRFNCNTWETVGTAGFSGYVEDPTSLAIYDSGGTPVPYFGYTDWDNSRKATVMKFNGSSWENVGVAGFSTGGVRCPSLAIYDNSGTPVPYISYSEVVISYYKVAVKKFNGVEWISVGESTPINTSGYYNSLFVFEKGGIPIPYIAFSSGQAFLRVFATP
ncbi:MAG: hypothetical protein AB2L14_04205 [Candidatus Xenobiia bacterium LiM19]